MRAVVATEPGGPEVLHVRDVDEPSPGPGQVAIEVAYAGLNFAEVLERRGALGPRPGPFVPGLEVSGRVRSLGSGVGQLEVGQPVCAYVRRGGYAEVALARAERIFAVDGDLATAAAMPTVGITAWTVLRDVARLRPGETVVVHAAAGGLGTLVGQLARHLGAGAVIGTVGDAAKAGYAAAFGYDHVMARDRFAEQAAGVDVVVDSVGGPARRDSIRVLAPGGRLVICGNASDADEHRPSAATLMARNLSVAGFSIDALATTPRFRAAGLELLDALAAGAARIDVTEIVDLDDIEEAHRRLEAGRTRGKLVLRVR
jgi:NADPH2:quinone reductase